MFALSLSTVFGEIAYEAVKFVVMLVLIVVAWMIGSTLRKKSDAKKNNNEA